MLEKYDLATGHSRNATYWAKESWTWEELAKRCMVPVRTGETFAVYQSSDLDFKQSKKDVGGFVSGLLRDNRRRKDSILDKQILTLDLDEAKSDFVSKLRALGPVAWIYYSTHSHSVEKPRYRLIMPLSKRVTPLEYEPIARWVANFFGLEQFDATGYDLNRLMYWPSAADDGAFEADWQHGSSVDVERILEVEYGGQYRDVTLWPRAANEFKAIREHAQDKMQDPHTKPGVIGAFCRMYTTRQMLDTLLSHIYAPSGDPNRYTYRQGSVSNGLWVIDDKFVYSWHNTDPMGGAPTNVFDMYRIHLCGGAEDIPGKRIEDQKSTKQALEQIRNMREIKLAMFREETGYSSAHAMFNVPEPRQMPPATQIQPQLAQNMWQQGIAAGAPAPQGVVQPLNIQPLNGHSASNGHVHAPTAAMGSTPAQAPVNPVGVDADDYWKGDLEVDGRMKPLANVKNVELIMENDPRIKGCFGRDIFAKQIVLRGMVPWIVPGRTAQWTDVDDDALINFYGRHYGINSADIIRRVLNEVTAKYGFHPVKEYLESLVWDGVPRIEQLFHYFLGVEDNHYTRQVSRKWFTAAVTRIYEPGRKFDYMPVFVGKAGLGKSYLVDKLGGKWFSDTSVDLRNKKESMEELQGVWIMEWGELTSFRTASIEAVKAFVSKRKDRYRAAYARRTEEHPRQLVFAGSTNVPKFLSDPDGNRRFWPLYVNQVPIQRNVHDHFTEELRGQLWAEACYMHAQGESLMLDEQARLLAEQVQAAHTEVDARELTILEYINKPVPLNWHEMNKGERAAFLGLGDFGSQPPADIQASGSYAPRNKVSVTEIWVECLGGEIKNMTKQNTRIIQDVMRNLDDWAYSKNQLYFGAFPRDRGFVRKDSGIKVRTGADNES